MEAVGAIPPTPPGQNGNPANCIVWVVGGEGSPPLLPAVCTPKPCGRGYALESIEVYSPKTKRWKESPIKLTEPRTFFGAATHDDRCPSWAGRRGSWGRDVVWQTRNGNKGIA